jgi:hypothetical protein
VTQSAFAQIRLHLHRLDSSHILHLPIVVLLDYHLRTMAVDTDTVEVVDKEPDKTGMPVLVEGRRDTAVAVVDNS